MTANSVKRYVIESEEWTLPISDSFASSDRRMTVKDREALGISMLSQAPNELNRKHFIFYWTNEKERKKGAKRMEIIDRATYIFVAAIVLGSVVLNSLLMLMFGTIGFAFYIVFSHIYEERLRARQKIADGNYLDLMYPSIERN